MIIEDRGLRMLIYKQNISKEELWKFSLPLVAILIGYLSLMLMGIVRDGEKETVIVFAGVLLIPILLLNVIVGLYYLEWFCVYADRIEAKSIYGIKNIVYFRNIQFVEELEINLTTRGMPRLFYIFHDGRENYRAQSVFARNSCYNKKKYNLRIRKTEAIERLVQGTGVSTGDGTVC